MSQQFLEDLRRAILDYDPELAAELARRAVREGGDLEAVMDTLIKAIREVGEDFGQGVLFLPDLIGAADALQAALPILEEAIKAAGTARRSLGRVIIGTVAGDIHTIGKAMVVSMLRAEGFEVTDLGIDVPVAEFVAAVDEQKPDIVAMSALLTSTAPEAGKVVAALSEAGLRERVKILVGGGAITRDFATGIGADGFAPTAPGAVKVARELLN